MSTELIRDQNKLEWDELDMQMTISTAKAHPRNITEFVSLTTKLATQDEETAQACFYYIPPSGQRAEPIEGGSVRLAEIAAYVWGNLYTGKRTIKNDGQFVTGEGLAWDLERNQGTRVQIQRSIINKYGKPFSYDMQATTANAAASIAFRNAVFTAIPKVFVDPIWIKAKKIAVGNKKDLSKRRNVIFDRFLQWDIDPKQILNFLKRNSVDELTQLDLEKLMGIGTAIKEGHITSDQAFVIKEKDTIEITNDDEHIKNLLK